MGSGLVLVLGPRLGLMPATPCPARKDRCSCSRSTVTAAARVASTEALAAVAGSAAAATAAVCSAAAAAPAGGRPAPPGGSEAAAGPAARLAAAAAADCWLEVGVGVGVGVVRARTRALDRVRRVRDTSEDTDRVRVGAYGTHSSSLSQSSQSKTQSGVGPERSPRGSGEGSAPPECDSSRRDVPAAAALAPSIALAPPTSGSAVARRSAPAGAVRLVAVGRREGSVNLESCCSLPSS